MKNKLTLSWLFYWEVMCEVVPGLVGAGSCFGKGTGNVPMSYTSY